MGFCLFNNVAVTAAALADAGERVLIVDYDAHHGNGTQDTFYDDPRVPYVSFHQYPLYPGTGVAARDRRGRGSGPHGQRPGARRAPPATSTGRRSTTSWRRWSTSSAPTWLLISAGFDAHRADPLTDLGLTAGDYADITADLLALVPAGPARWRSSRAATTSTRSAIRPRPHSVRSPANGSTSRRRRAAARGATSWPPRASPISGPSSTTGTPASGSAAHRRSRRASGWRPRGTPDLRCRGPRPMAAPGGPAWDTADVGDGTQPPRGPSSDRAWVGAPPPPLPPPPPPAAVSSSRGRVPAADRAADGPAAPPVAPEGWQRPVSWRPWRSPCVAVVALTSGDEDGDRPVEEADVADDGSVEDDELPTRSPARVAR